MMFTTNPDMVSKYKKISLIGLGKIINPNKEIRNIIDDIFDTLVFI